MSGIDLRDFYDDQTLEELYKIPENDPVWDMLMEEGKDDGCMSFYSGPPKYILALDQGTTSSRTLLIDKDGKDVSAVQQSYKLIYPQPGWVEVDPYDILETQLGTLAGVVQVQQANRLKTAAIGIANQRETTIIWNRETSEPIANGIVWQCRRTAELVQSICGDPEIARKVTEKTGLVPDAYFSASKIAWLLDNVEGAREDAEAGKLAFGTVDTWLMWTLSNGEIHATDVTNASRTMLFNIHTGEWDPWLLDLFDIPASLLPEVKPSAAVYGRCARLNGLEAIEGVLIAGVAGDQQAALFGQGCTEEGQAKNTYGTGCFTLLHTGTKACASEHGLVTTIAASAPAAAGGPERGTLEYALEGSVFMGGALIQWVRDGLGFIKESSECEEIAKNLDDNAGVYIVPAFTGLGAPYWDPDARGTITGLSRGVGRDHIVRAAVEAMAYQVNDLLTAMKADSGCGIAQMLADGGAARNSWLLQFQSDVSDVPVMRAGNVEATAFGAAYLAGLTVKFWESIDEVKSLMKPGELFMPAMEEEKRESLVAGWKDAVHRALSFE